MCNYFEACSRVRLRAKRGCNVCQVKDILDQPDFNDDILLQELLLKAFRNVGYRAKINRVCDIDKYSTDFESCKLWELNLKHYLLLA